MPGVAGGAVYTVQASMFEGLFVHGLAVEPGSAFARELAEAGYSLGATTSHYDIAVWAACLDVSWRRLHAGLPRFEAWRLLGREFVEGYFQTLVGRAIAAVLPLLAVERFLDRVPHFMRTGLGGSTCDVDQPSRGVASLEFHGPHPGAAFVMTGVLEACFARMGASGTFEPAALDGVESRLDLRWTS